MIVKKSKKTKKLNKEISLFITSTVIDEYEFKKSVSHFDLFSQRPRIQNSIDDC